MKIKTLLRCPEFIVISFLVLLIFLLALSKIVHINTNPGTGTKIGQIVRLNRTGILFNTWEAELIRGGLNNSQGSFGIQPFHFTIQNEDMAKIANHYLTNQTEVVISYRIQLFTFRKNSDNGIFLEKIEPK